MGPMTPAVFKDAYKTVCRADGSSLVFILLRGVFDQMLRVNRCNPQFYSKYWRISQELWTVFKLSWSIKLEFNLRIETWDEPRRKLRTRRFDLLDLTLRSHWIFEKLCFIPLSLLRALFPSAVNFRRLRELF